MMQDTDVSALERQSEFDDGSSSSSSSRGDGVLKVSVGFVVKTGFRHVFGAKAQIGAVAALALPIVVCCYVAMLQIWSPDSWLRNYIGSANDDVTPESQLAALRAACPDVVLSGNASVDDDARAAHVACVSAYANHAVLAVFSSLLPSRTLIAASVAFLALLLFVETLFFVSVLHFVWARCTSTPTSVGQTLVMSLKRMPAAMAVNALGTLFIVVGLLLLVVPGVIAAVLFSVALPAVVLEPETGVCAAFARAKTLTFPRLVSVCCTGCASALLAWVVSLAFTLPTFAAAHLLGTLPAGAVIAPLMSALSMLVIAALMSSFITVLYFALRLVRGDAPPPGSGFGVVATLGHSAAHVYTTEQKAQLAAATGQPVDSAIALDDYDIAAAASSSSSSFDASATPPAYVGIDKT